jgi:hypothetical protein
VKQGSGRLRGSDTESWAKHFEECERCIAAIRTVAPGTDDTLLSALAQSSKVAPGYHYEDAVPRLIDRIKSLGRLLPKPPADVTRVVPDRASGGDRLCDDVSIAFLNPPEGEGEIRRLGGYRVCACSAPEAWDRLQSRRPASQARVALKVIKPELAAGPTARGDF